VTLYLSTLFAFSDLTLLYGHQEWHPLHKNGSTKVPKMCPLSFPFYFLNNSVESQPILIIFDTHLSELNLTSEIISLHLRVKLTVHGAAGLLLLGSECQVSVSECTLREGGAC